MLGNLRGRIRYLGVLLYDAGPHRAQPPAWNDRDLYQAQLDIFPKTPTIPDVIKQARIDGIPDSWMEAARNSPVYKMAVRWKVALPLHPEYRTRPWSGTCHLSPITAAANAGHVGVNGDIPGRLAAAHSGAVPGQPCHGWRHRPVVQTLERMLARTYQRDKHVEQRQTWPCCSRRA